MLLSGQSVARGESPLLPVQPAVPLVAHTESPSTTLSLLSKKQQRVAMPKPPNSFTVGSAQPASLFEGTSQPEVPLIESLTRTRSPFDATTANLVPFFSFLRGMDDVIGKAAATFEDAGIQGSKAALFRETHAIAPEAPVVLCLPGSRRSEVSRLARRFDEALLRLRDRLPEIRIVLPTVPGVADMVHEMTRRWPTAPIVLEDPVEKRAAFAAADLALAASGTVSLELAANRIPMVIGYDMAPLSRLVVGMLLRTDTVTLVNLVSDTRAVPEFLGKACQPGAIAQALQDALEDSTARKAQLDAMDLTMDRLGKGGEAPGLRAARSVLGSVTEPR